MLSSYFSFRAFSPQLFKSMGGRIFSSRTEREGHCREGPQFHLLAITVMASAILIAVEGIMFAILRFANGPPPRSRLQRRSLEHCQLDGRG
jgi:hypothetical protein